MSLAEDVAAAYVAWDAAFNRADATAVAANYVASAKLLPPTHVVVSGPAEIEAFFGGLFANGIADHRLELIEAGGDEAIAFATAKWTATAEDQHGSRQTIGGLATHVFERQADGSLKLKMHTFN